MASASDEGRSKLAANILHFARVLRRAGLPVGTGQAIDAIDGVAAVGVASREDFYWTLHAAFVKRRGQREIFDQAFHVFWRNPQLLERMLSLVLPAFRQDDDTPREEMAPRLAEAMSPRQPGPDAPQPEAEDEDIEIDAAMTWSGRETLSQIDFEKMTNDEVAAAKNAMQRMRLEVQSLKTRRFQPDQAGRRADMRATLRASLRGSGVIPLRRRSRRKRPPALVILCDISGSMSRYSRMLIHFMHALTDDRDRVHSFLFGTRLTNVTRQLRNRDVDAALASVGAAAADWAGGTRIGECLTEFNHTWSRRILGQGAVVLLITDGLERDAPGVLDAAVERLSKSCRRLIWLNPLLRYDAYEPKAQGAQAMLPWVDEFRPVHNLESLHQLAEALTNEHTPRLADGPAAA